MSILIINPMQDAHCQHLMKKLSEKGVQYKELCSPLENDYALQENKLLYNGEQITGIQSVYFRGVMARDPSAMEQHTAAAQYTDQVQFSARSEVITNWLHILDLQGKRVINPPTNISKYLQLYKLQQAGIPLPQTCITSSPEIAKHFISKIKNAVFKPLTGGSYCERVTPALLKQLDLIQAEPAIFQEEIPGEDIRINMLNGKMLSAHTIKTDAHTLDYRTHPSYSAGKAVYEEVFIPEDVSAYCKKAMDILGLRFSGIDLRRTAQGTFILIECNSMPAFLDIEFKTGAPITEGIIQDLLECETNDNKEESVSTAFQFSAKTNIQQGKSLFDYYGVVTDWASQGKKEKKKTMVIELNESQKKQYRLETGTEANRVEIEVDRGEIRVVKVID